MMNSRSEEGGPDLSITSVTVCNDVENGKNILQSFNFLLSYLLFVKHQQCRITVNTEKRDQFKHFYLNILAGPA